MNWFKDNRRDAAFIAITLAVPVFLLLVVVIDLFGMRAGYQGEIDRLEPRIARLMGLAAQEDELGSAASAVDARLLDLVYPITEDRASVSASLQKNVRDIFSDTGMVINNSQMLPIEQNEGLDRISVKVTASGSLDALDTSLSDVASYRPLLMVESMEIHPGRGASARGQRQPQTVVATIQILALRQAQ